MSELPKTFDPSAIEQRWYEHWESKGLFRPARPDEEPWTIVMPPPNVTGSLHIGHALDNTLQDVLTRRERMRGKDALWVVGTDHAGIATQMVVERNLESQGVKRAEIGREAFLEHVWEWKAQSGGSITRQLRRLGASCDWANERFTMDPGFSKAVIKVFVELYNRKLLYRAKRLVNWDPKFQTAISDLEVENREVQGHMWHFKYPLADGETYTYVEKDEDGNVTFQETRDYISIATTRPETMLGDGAVAVHPDDVRYRPIVGKLCEIPVGPKEHRRLIPIITDDYPDPNFGSGAVKITGAHDLNDYGVAQRNGIPMYRLMDGTAHMRSDGPSYEESAKRAVEIARGATASPEEVDALNLVPEEYRGLDRYDARKAVVADIDAEGLMVTVEDKLIMQPFGDRSGLVIEPMLTDQWYVDAETLAKPAIEAVRSGDIAVVPETWKKTWFNWLENIQPWCVSRQLWWGHRIPAWFDASGNVFVAETFEEAQQQAGEGVELRQDEDVLDTWFSSALWPFATLGWPDATDDLKRHYPNDVLISGFDIIFFWDARMAMQGFEFMGERPWKTLYLHGLVRDAKGQKMSKSKGNTVDPLGLIDKYGADALRFTMAAMESQGRDIKLDEKRVEGYRNFATKLWNAARFLQMKGVGASQSIAAPEVELPVNRWIIGEVVETLALLDKAFDELRFDDMANAIYHFTWGTFCDWYLELVKGAFDEETKRVAAWAFDQILVMLHPFMPFVTEELWNANERPYELIVAKWPEPQAQGDPRAKAEIEWLIDVVSEVRSARTELNVPPSAKLHLFATNAPDEIADRLDRLHAMLTRLARLESIQLSPFDGAGAAQVVVGGTTYALPLGGVIDLAAERGRLLKAVGAAEKERDNLAQRLNNPAFTERAKPEAVDKARSDYAEKSAEAERYRAALERLG
ncbi:valine--tRNA ligase [Sphingomonas sediminicola]|uniref:Valine--tRNA ligase n=1 Tax=Sphingomonas sediminicola TaxID=386874 RepID=A0ABX6T8V4_9SPHN|nr:valine--tRNA ligase [Sphingomonas sediminicola]QNP46297.1 valine--tRNA ligase [Sphingomonas sediminicola]